MLSIVSWFCLTCSSFAQISEGTVLKDPEIVHIFKSFLSPMYEKFGLKVETADIYLIVNQNINAFVLPNGQTFVHTALITKYDSPLPLVGILAHEIAHIKNHHISQRIDQFEQMSKKSTIALALSLLAIPIAPIASVLGIAATTTSMTGEFFCYSMGAEGAADSNALEVLQRLNWPASGLLKVMDEFAQEESVLGDMLPQYWRTHPFSRDRVAQINHFIDTNPYANAFPAKLTWLYKILRAKLLGYLLDPRQVIKQNIKIIDDDTKYMCAIANFRLGKLNVSLKLIDQLIQKHSDYIFFQDFKALVLMHLHKQDKALGLMNTLLTLSPDPLRRVSYIAMLLDSPKIANIHLAKLELTKIPDKRIYRNVLYWHYRAIVHGKLKENGWYNIAQAEKFLKLRHKKLATQFCKKNLAKNQDTGVYTHSMSLMKEINKLAG